MALAMIGNFRDLVEIVVTGISLVGGAMALVSGWAARESIRMGESPEQVSFRVNQGLASGFSIGLSIALVAVAILGST